MKLIVRLRWAPLGKILSPVLAHCKLAVLGDSDHGGNAHALDGDSNGGDGDSGDDDIGEST